MEGDYQQQVSQQGWLEGHSTLTLTLSESTVWRWEQAAREHNVADHSAMAAFLLRHYEETRCRLMQTSMCSSCGTPLGQFCATCFSLTPKLQQQVCSGQSAVSTRYDTSCGLGQTHPPLCSNTASQADHPLTSQSRGGTSTEGIEAADESFGSNAADYDDNTDDEYYARDGVVETKANIMEQKREKGSVYIKLEKKESANPRGESETFTCEICSQVFFDPDQLVMHTQTHGDHMLHECCQCRVRFFQEDILTLHTNTHHQPQQAHACDQCSASFSREASLAKHTALSHNNTKTKRRGKRSTDSTPRTGGNEEDSETTTKPEARNQAGEEWERDQEDTQSDLRSGTLSGQQQSVPSETRRTEEESGAETDRDGSKFSCLRCGREFLQKHHLERHGLTHSGEKRYGCQRCGAAFAQLNSLVTHARSHYSHNKPFLCGQCHKSFTTLSYMSKHACKAKRTQPRCLHCGETFGSRGQLALHSCSKPEESSFIRSEGDGENRSKRRKTKSVTLKENSKTMTKRPRGRPRKNLVNDDVKSKEESNSGVKSNANPQPGSGEEEAQARREETHPHRCTFCGARFTFLNHLTSHEQDHTGEKAFKCPQCPESFRSAARLTNHARTHNSAGKQFPCQYCGKILKSLYTLKEHLRSHTGEKPFKCDVCDAGFTLSSTYRAHLRTHTGDRPYLCPHCGKSFVRSSNLSVHIRACTGERPYACAQCGKSFSDVGYYRKHVNNHAGIRPYKCQHCGKAFSQSTSLKLHVRIHTGEKPYKCSQCPMAFSIPNSLTEHMRKHTGDKPYKCSICGKGFAKSCNRLAHFRTHSKNSAAVVPAPHQPGTGGGGVAGGVASGVASGGVPLLPFVTA